MANGNPPLSLEHTVSPVPQTIDDRGTDLESPTPLIDRYIDEWRALNVAIIGGGLAGVLATILLRAKVPNIKLTIYEKNKDFVSHAESNHYNAPP